MAESQKYTELLLIGKTGNGKSATGNSILGRKVFRCLANPTSVTREIQMEYSDICGRIIKVVDGPGVCDTDLSQEDALKLVIESMQYAIAANPKGYHAFLLVVRYGGRFTKEDAQTVELLKGIFGADFVEKFTILVVTYGDIFDPEEANCRTFEEWCAKQTGVFKAILNECSNRVILFDNRTQDVAKQNDQRERLLRMVDSLSRQGLRYSDQHFMMAEKERDRIQVEAKVPMIREETMREASLIIQQLSKIQLDEPEQQLDRLGHLYSRAELLVQTIINQDKGTGALNDVLKNARHISQNVDEQIKNTKKAVEIRAQKRQYAEEMEKLKAQEDQNKLKQQAEAQNETELKIAQLQNKIEQSEARYEELLKYLQENNRSVEEEYRQVATIQNEGLLSRIMRAITTLLPAAVKIIFRM